MFPENYFIYIQLILFYFITPGPPRVLIIVSYTISHGLKKSVWTAFGDISANFVQAALVTFVIFGSVFIDNPSIFKYVKWAAILYLLYLAYEIFSLKKIQKIDIGYKNSKTMVLAMFRDGFIVIFVLAFFFSPKAYFFLVQFFFLL